MRLEIQPAIEAFKISKIMRVQFLSFEPLDQFRNGATLFAHEVTVGKGINGLDSPGKTNPPRGNPDIFSVTLPSALNCVITFKSDKL